MSHTDYTEVVTSVTDEVLKAYQSARLHTTRRIQIFEADGETPWLPENLQARLVSGDISVDGSRAERRSLNCVLSNKDKYLKHSPKDGFWYDKIIKAYRGLVYTDALGVKKKYETQVGEFMIDNLSSSRFPGHIAVTGRDYAKKLLKDQFAVDTAFSSGVKLDDLVRTIAVNAGIKKFRLNVPQVVVGAPAAFARKTSRWDAIKKLCEDLNVEVYFDGEGYLVTRPYDDVATSPPYFKLSFAPGEQNVIDYSKSSSDSNIYNHIVVIGTSEEETVTGYKFISIKENTDAASPTSISQIGRRTFEYEVSYITSQAEADALSTRLLNFKALEDYTLSFTTLCLPWLEAYRVLEFDDPDEDASVPTRFLYTSFSIPLGIGSTSGEAKRIAIVGKPDAVVDDLALEDTDI